MFAIDFTIGFLQLLITEYNIANKSHANITTKLLLVEQEQLPKPISLARVLYETWLIADGVWNVPNRFVLKSSLPWGSGGNKHICLKTSTVFISHQPQIKKNPTSKAALAHARFVFDDDVIQPTTIFLKIIGKVVVNNQ